MFHGSGEVIAHRAAEFEEFSGGHDADGVEAFVIGTGAAVAVAIETGERGVAAGLQGLSKYVAGHGGLMVMVIENGAVFLSGARDSAGFGGNVQIGNGEGVINLRFEI